MHEVINNDFVPYKHDLGRRKVCKKLLNYKAPIVISEQVWNKFIFWSEEDEINQFTDAPQSFERRLSEVLWVLFLKLAVNNEMLNGDVNFYIRVVPRDGVSTAAIRLQLKARLNKTENGIVITAP